MVLELDQDRELAGRRRQAIGAVQDHGGPDLVPAAEDRDDLRLEIDADPRRALGHAFVIPAIVAVLHPPRHRENRVHRVQNQATCERLPGARLW